MLNFDDAREEFVAGYRDAMLWANTYRETADGMEDIDVNDYVEPEDVERADAGSSNGTELGLEDWTMEIPDDEYLDMLFDPADVDVEELHALATVGDVVRYALIGCGRVFSSEIEWARIFDADLLARITEWED